jgi:hypothetical protein
MRTALEDLALDHLWVVYPGEHRYPIDERISAWPIQDVAALPEALGASRRRRPTRR